MATFSLTHYFGGPDFAELDAFEEAWCQSRRCYSLRHLLALGIVSPELMMEALEKALQICSLAGVNIREHFKQIYVFDAAAGATRTDWLMSKKAFNLVITQYPALNGQVAAWVCELLDL
jgi:hypothetical protein